MEKYEEYLQSEHWNKYRTIRIALTPYCQFCGGKENLEVHHLRYYDDRGRSILGSEEYRDSMVLCHSCHMRFHSTEREYGNSLKKTSGKSLCVQRENPCDKVIMYERKILDILEHDSNKIMSDGKSIRSHFNRIFSGHGFLDDGIGQRITQLLKIPDGPEEYYELSDMGEKYKYPEAYIQNLSRLSVDEARIEFRKLEEGRAAKIIVFYVLSTLEWEESNIKKRMRLLKEDENRDRILEEVQQLQNVWISFKQIREKTRMDLSLSDIKHITTISLIKS